MRWRKISTAPKDGTVVILFGKWETELHMPDETPEVGAGKFGGNRWSAAHVCYYGIYCEPTLWMPIPKPPK